MSTADKELAPDPVLVVVAPEGKSMRRSASQQNMANKGVGTSDGAHGSSSRSASPHPGQAHVREVAARPLGMELGKVPVNPHFEYTFKSDKKHAREQQRQLYHQQQQAQQHAYAYAQANNAAQHALALARRLSSTPPPVQQGGAATPPLPPGASSSGAFFSGARATPPHSPVQGFAQVASEVDPDVAAAANAHPSIAAAEVAATAAIFAAVGAAAVAASSSAGSGLNSPSLAATLAGAAPSSSAAMMGGADAAAAAPFSSAYPGYSLSGSGMASSPAAASVSAPAAPRADTAAVASSVAAAVAASAASAGPGGLDVVALTEAITQSLLAQGLGAAAAPAASVAAAAAAEQTQLQAPSFGHAAPLYLHPTSSTPGPEQQQAHYHHQQQAQTQTPQQLSLVAPVPCIAGAGLLPPLPKSTTPTPCAAGGSSAGAAPVSPNMGPTPAAQAAAAAAAVNAAAAQAAHAAAAQAGIVISPSSVAAAVHRNPLVVFKIGSSSISNSDGRLSLNLLSSFVEMVCDMRRDGYDVVIITSGAVSVGCQRLGMRERPKHVVTKQAIAAVGQGRLMRLYDDLFSLLGQPIAQLLLSRENLAQEHHYLNALNTFRELLRLGIVPVVNENDTVAVQELRFGDNDTLSALVASIIQADWLFLLTDVDALYTANPRQDPTARAVRVVPDVNTLSVDTGDANPLSGKWGTGGMATKLQAASIATSAGVRTAVCSTERLGDIKRMLQGHTDVGTQFVPSPVVLSGRKKWIALGLVPVGNIVIDDGAAQGVIKKRSLFAAGITGVVGKFPANSAVRIVASNGREIGRGLTLYSSRELGVIKGLHSDGYAQALGYNGPAAVIHRENLALFPSAYSFKADSNAAQHQQQQRQAGGLAHRRSATAAAAAAGNAGAAGGDGKSKRSLRFNLPAGAHAADSDSEHEVFAHLTGSKGDHHGSDSDDDGHHHGHGNDGNDDGCHAGANAEEATTPGGGLGVCISPPAPGADSSGGGGDLPKSARSLSAVASVSAASGVSGVTAPHLKSLAGGVEVLARPDSRMSNASSIK